MLPAGYEKKSFRRFDIGIDSARLVAEYRSIPEDHWLSSYWGRVHCSVAVLLLRGGDSGTEADFFADQVIDHPWLPNLPYMQSLIGQDGPFGGAKYAFLLRMVPNGCANRHRDLREQWIDLYRVHIPVTTNDGAYAIAEERSIHFAKGYAWTFDNQALHGAVNGSAERAHLILDIPYSQTMASLIEGSDYLPGTIVPEHNDLITSKKIAAPEYPGDQWIRMVVLHLSNQGKTASQIADMLNSKNVATKFYRRKWTDMLVSDVLGDKAVVARFR